MGETLSDFFQPGEHFHGYVIERGLGRGAAGAVYLVRHEVLDTLYALKVLSPDVADADVTFVKRFLREARLATRIRHPNLVTVHDCGHDSEKNLYYLVMDYVPGGSLRDEIAIGGKFTVEHAAEVVMQVASALDAAQAYQVVHRDIKPENIMIQPDGRVKLVDLGIAKAQNLGDSLRTNTDNVFGTPSYVSPEQAQCSADVDVRADIYSLGIVFFEMLAGRCPYDERNPAQLLAKILSDDPIPDVRDICSGIPAEVAVLVRRMTMKDRDRRISSFAAVIKELNRLGLGQSYTAPSASEIIAKREVGMKTLLSGLNAPSHGTADYDPAADDDAEVRQFVQTRNKMQHTKKVVRIAVVVVVLAVIVSLAVVALCS